MLHNLLFVLFKFGNGCTSSNAQVDLIVDKKDVINKNCITVDLSPTQTVWLVVVLVVNIS